MKQARRHTRRLGVSDAPTGSPPGRPDQEPFAMRMRAPRRIRSRRPSLVLSGRAADPAVGRSHRGEKRARGTRRHVFARSRVEAARSSALLLTEERVRRICPSRPAFMVARVKQPARCHDAVPVCARRGGNVGRSAARVLRPVDRHFTPSRRGSIRLEAVTGRVALCVGRLFLADGAESP